MNDLYDYLEKDYGYLRLPDYVKTLDDAYGYIHDDYYELVEEYFGEDVSIEDYSSHFLLNGESYTFVIDLEVWSQKQDRGGRLYYPERITELTITKDDEIPSPIDRSNTFIKLSDASENEIEFVLEFLRRNDITHLRI